MPLQLLCIMAAICLLLSRSQVVFAITINGFGDFSQWTYNQNPNDTGSAPTVIPGQITLTDGGGSEARSLFYDTAVPTITSSFEASFTYQVPVGSGTVFDFDPSLAFVIQNSPQGLHAVGQSGESFAYSGITNSAAVSLQLVGSGATGGGDTGYFTGGNVTTAMSTSPVIPTLGDPINVVLTYNGSLLTETLTDSVAGTVFSKNYLVNLGNAIGGTTAYIGFTAATDNSGFQPPQSQTLSNFHFSSPIPEPPSIVLTGAAILVLIGWRLRVRTLSHDSAVPLLPIRSPHPASQSGHS